ncbi:MAG: TetR/AcrR family transcriptional regulator [Acidimicrobiales bacterium]
MSTTKDTGFGDQSGTVELLWGLRHAPNRGPKPALSVERIARVAMRIADAEGLAAVSMQRVAGELDFTKMSLYRHVDGKAELMAAMIELAVGVPPDLSRVRGGWRPKLERFVEHLAESWHRHPWLPWATMGDRVMGPNEIGWVECAVRALDGTGLNGGEQLDAVFVLFGHIRNTQSRATAGTQPWTTERQFSPAIVAVVPDLGDRFPALATAVGSVRAKAARDNGRAFGLRCLFGGLERLIATRSSAR